MISCKKCKYSQEREEGIWCTKYQQHVSKADSWCFERKAKEKTCKTCKTCKDCEHYESVWCDMCVASCKEKENKMAIEEKDTNHSISIVFIVLLLIMSSGWVVGSLIEDHIKIYFADKANVAAEEESRLEKIEASLEGQAETLQKKISCVENGHDMVFIGYEPEYKEFDGVIYSMSNPGYHWKCTRCGKIEMVTDLSEEQREEVLESVGLGDPEELNNPWYITDDMVIIDGDIEEDAEYHIDEDIVINGMSLREFLLGVLNGSGDLEAISYSDIAGIN